MNGRENWTYEDYQSNDPKALENLKVTNLEEYQILFNNKIDTSIKAGRDEWTYLDWSNNDPEGLANIEKNHREKYFELYNNAVNAKLI